MQRLLLNSVLLFLLASPYNAQSVKTDSSADDALPVEKSILLSELQNLHTESLKLDTPLAHALANTEIADAAWALDQGWAKRLMS